MDYRWHTTAEVAQRLGLSIPQTLRLIHENGLVAFRIGGSAGYRISESALEKLLKDRPDRR